MLIIFSFFYLVNYLIKHNLGYRSLSSKHNSYSFSSLLSLFRRRPCILLFLSTSNGLPVLFPPPLTGHLLYLTYSPKQQIQTKTLSCTGWRMELEVFTNFSKLLMKLNSWSQRFSLVCLRCWVLVYNFDYTLKFVFFMVYSNGSLYSFFLCRFLFNF